MFAGSEATSPSTSAETGIGQVALSMGMFENLNISGVAGFSLDEDEVVGEVEDAGKYSLRLLFHKNSTL